MLQCCLVFGRWFFLLKNLPYFLQTEKIRNVCHIVNLEVMFSLEVLSGCQQVSDIEQSTKQNLRVALGCTAL